MWVEDDFDRVEVVMGYICEVVQRLTAEDREMVRNITNLSRGGKCG